MKKLLALLLALIMIFSFVACDKDEDDSDDGTSYEDDDASENKDDDGDSDDEDTKDNGADAESEDLSKSYKNDAYKRFGVAMMNCTLAKLDSLGKTEENKKLVEFYASENFYVAVSVYTWSDPESAYDLCESYYFYNSDNYLYQEMLTEEGIVEHNADELWIKFESTGEEDKEDLSIEWGDLTYSDVYDYITSSSLFEIIE